MDVGTVATLLALGGVVLGLVALCLALSCLRLAQQGVAEATARAEEAKHALCRLMGQDDA